MKKKRFIFTLLYDNGYFALSRNFRLQRIGNAKWLINNCNFFKMMEALDELIILDCSRSDDKKKELRDCFFDEIVDITKRCFAPLSIGGKIRSIDDADRCFENGADKIVVNTIIYENLSLIDKIIEKYGSQALVASIDIDKSLNCYSRQGSFNTKISLAENIEVLNSLKVGEVLINSIDKDGTGMGLDFNAYEEIKGKATMPIIITGGIGHSDHMIEAYTKGINAVTTSNLLNFVGDGIVKTRTELMAKGVDLPRWN